MSTFYDLLCDGAEVSLFSTVSFAKTRTFCLPSAANVSVVCFAKLLKVSNVGPSWRSGCCRGMSVDAFALCVGPMTPIRWCASPRRSQTAERLIIEMRDRIKHLGEAGGALPVTGRPDANAGAQAEAFSALIALGYKPAEVTRLLRAVDSSIQTTEEVIRRALQAAATG